MADRVDVVAPVPGLVASIAVARGATVAAGDTVVTLQSMKMEIAVPSDLAGTVEEVLVAEGQEVEMGAVLARVRAAEPSAVSLKKVLVANRGEPAARALRAGREGGIATLALRAEAVRGRPC